MRGEGDSTTLQYVTVMNSQQSQTTYKMFRCCAILDRYALALKPLREFCCSQIACKIYNTYT